MTHRLTVTVVAIASFVCGALAAGVIGYLGIARIFRDQFESSFYANAAHAQFEARALSNLRAGNTDKVISDLELMLKSHTMQLAGYESAVPAERRNQLVYDALGEVRVYIEKFPAHFENAIQEAEFRKALALDATSH